MTDTPRFGMTVCGIEELGSHAGLAATHVLSILDPDHPVPEAFGQYGEHAKLELRFHDIIDPQPGMILPSEADVAAILAFGRQMQAEVPAARLLVHCHAGISRSTAAMALIIAQAMPETAAAAVLEQVHGLREKTWPNLRMIELGDRALGRRGSLVAAAFALYRLQIEKRPHVAEFMEKGGRGREVAGARLLSPLDL
ncbi:protein-tyrosine-phosphatase [Acidisoma cellulosilytica]|uniref:Protein-tyrosine-phosphatase n=1 Tax=Acidisoma cellulosilyticum TaxID=2802395 RepID=A0A963Z2Z3_9PROT|nr:protein-tyrosine-phosphatase [Acidisoma cellulosilyticum]MCB8881830.1 protein-tyrosine-phosphatase [Acidisoma cellulosilyticum]